MAEAVGTVRVDLEAGWAKFKDGMSKASLELGKFGGKVQEVAGSVVKGGALLAGAAVAAGAAWVLASARVAQASQELQSQFNTAFGDMASEATAWATALGDATGRGTQDIERTAVQFQDLFAAITPTSEAALQASQHFTQLALDFAALKNISVEDSVRALNTAVVSGGRSMAQYGIDLSDAAVNARALREGLIQNGQTLTQQGEQLIRAQILTEALSDAQGEYARNAGSAADSAARLQGQLEEAQTSIGNKLLPIWTTLNQIISYFIGLLTGAGEALGNLIFKVLQFFNLVPTGTGRIQAMGDAVEGAGTAARNTAPKFVNMARGLGAVIAQGTAARTWAQEHKNDIDRIRGSYDRATQALRDYAEDMQIATRAGLDLQRAQQSLGMAAIQAAGGVKAMRDQLESLPAPIRELVEQQLPKLQQEAQTASDRMAEFAQSINERFGPKSQAQTEIERLNALLQEGVIDLETYKRAKDDLLGQETTTNMQDAAELAGLAYDRLQERMARVKNTLLDLATGTKSFEDTWRTLVLEFLKSRWIEPFLDALLQKMAGAKGGGGGIFGGGAGAGGGGFLGQIAGFASSILGFGGGKANGGNVMPGMAYQVGERGKELFVPDQRGTIVDNDTMQGMGATVNQYITTPDANSFLASRRQVARAGRRAIGV